MSSVRSRIEAIEALAKNQQPEADNQNESTTTSEDELAYYTSDKS